MSLREEFIKGCKKIDGDLTEHENEVQCGVNDLNDVHNFVFLKDSGIGGSSVSQTGTRIEVMSIEGNDNTMKLNGEGDSYIELTGVWR